MNPSVVSSEKFKLLAVQLSCRDLVDAISNVKFEVLDSDHLRSQVPKLDLETKPKATKEKFAEPISLTSELNLKHNTSSLCNRNRY